MKKLLLGILLTILSVSVFSQEKTYSLKHLSETFDSDTTIYDLILKSGGVLVKSVSDEEKIIWDINNDKIGIIDKIIYSFKDRHLISYSILFKNDKMPSLQDFCDLYGNHNNDNYWTNDEKIYVRLIEVDKTLIIGLK